MTGDYFLDLNQNEGGTLLLPVRCRVSVSCYDSEDVQRANELFSPLSRNPYTRALSEMGLNALDGVTVALDARKAASELQDSDEGVVPLEMSDQPETLELARTVAVRRGNEFRLHIILRAGLGLMSLSSQLE